MGLLVSSGEDIIKQCGLFGEYLGWETAGRLNLKTALLSRLLAIWEMSTSLHAVSVWNNSRNETKDHAVITNASFFSFAWLTSFGDCRHMMAWCGRKLGRLRKSQWLCSCKILSKKKKRTKVKDTFSKQKPVFQLPDHFWWDWLTDELYCGTIRVWNLIGTNPVTVISEWLRTYTVISFISHSYESHKLCICF